MTDYNCIFVLPNGSEVKQNISDDITFQQIKTLIATMYKGPNYTLSLSNNAQDSSKVLKAVNWTKVLTLDNFKKKHPLGLVSQSEVEFDDGSDSLICKFYILAV
eukprot:gene19195-22995_t